MVLYIAHFAKDGNVLGENMRKLGSPLDILKGQGFALASLFTRDLTSGHVWPGSSDNGRLHCRRLSRQDVYRPSKVAVKGDI